MGRNHNWTEEERDYLNDNWGVQRDQVVARYLGRSIEACKVKATRAGLSRLSNIYTARMVGRIFGVDSKTVLRWGDRGWLRIRRAGRRSGKFYSWDVDLCSIETFIQDMVWAYDWHRMEEGTWFQNLARKAWEDDPWLTVAEVCDKIAWQPQRLKKWLRRGLVPHRRRPKQGQHGDRRGLIVIREVDIPSLLEEVSRVSHENRSRAAKLWRKRY